MRDTNLLLTDSAVAADAFAANALSLDGTPADGVWLMLKITRNDADADETLDINFYAKDANSGWATTDERVGKRIQIVNADVANGGSIIRYAHIQTKKNFVKPHYDVGGTTPSWTIECGVCTGPDQKETAALG